MFTENQQVIVKLPLPFRATIIRACDISESYWFVDIDGTPRIVSLEDIYLIAEVR